MTHSVDISEYVMIGHPDVTIRVAPYMRARGGEYTVNVRVEAEAAMYHFPFRKLAEAKAKAVAVANGGL